MAAKKRKKKSAPIETAGILRKQIQTITGKNGNCFSTCIACILQIPAARIPNFCHEKNENWRDATNDWLGSIGFFYIDFTLIGDMRDELIRYWGYHVISGNGPRKRRHSVVGLQGELFHDPYPGGCGLIGGPDEWEHGFVISKSLVCCDRGRDAPPESF